MKLFITLFLTVLVTVSSHAQFRNDSTEYVVKIEKYHSMRTIGTMLTVVGTGLFVAGIVTMANNVWTTEHGFETGFGIWVVGTASLGAGIPLWIVGAHQHKKYSEKLKKLTLNLQAGVAFQGLTVRYRF